ncbi:hypothetical protein G7B40_038965 [Aetokthonos hydrillicola Thurmond2011]|jgi:hypothetical protein|uniref:Uncharacterized protein n=1 Tax=Aetokthonos hydrillicola Thurmond2011 TaxID=2712845 RepID=A0AAP5IGE9_9CYAN|nr:hypothetical protein [Aetokthonos hydrillicola]MBW4591204.1 hypothetical protein [Aetokthonos hydrillicola CCALA 1050]MDR9900487.1 hypothetical protein [Aetokthonos hydrillicola Thurmond2011]
MEFEFEFEQLQPLPVRPEQEQEKEIFQPKWHCFCCKDTGRVQPELVRRVIPSYNYDRDRIPICQNCNEGQKRWAHLNDLGIIDQRLTFQICRKLDLLSREDWKRTTEVWFEMAKKRVEEATTEISAANNMRRRARIQAEFILAQEKHGRARGDWEEIPEQDEEEDEE